MIPLKSDIDICRTSLEARIDAQFVKLAAFFLPLVIAVAGLVLAAVSIA